jgi:hypothetical protein
VDIKTMLRSEYKSLSPALTERSRRLWGAATEAKAPGDGGIAKVEEATGISPSTIQRGLRELEAGETLNRSERADRVVVARPQRRRKL